ncbi:MAG: c-type cytochrome domain-containing protein [Verrucomicrobiota bacterium]
MSHSSLIFSSLLVLLAYPASALDYEQDILPMLESRCANCHLDGSSKGGVAFDLDKVGRDIGAGKTIVPGEPDSSDLIERVTLPEDDGDVMPPQGKGRPLSDGDVAKLKEWIEAGAVVGNEEPEMTEATAEDRPPRPDPIAGRWTNTSGKTIEATLIRVEGSNAILRMGTKDYPYPIANLDATAQATIKSFADEWAKSEGL